MSSQPEQTWQTSIATSASTASGSNQHAPVLDTTAKRSAVNDPQTMASQGDGMQSFHTNPRTTIDHRINTHPDEFGGCPDIPGDGDDDHVRLQALHCRFSCCEDQTVKAEHIMKTVAVKYRSLRTNLIHLPISLYASLAQQQVRPQSLIVHLSPVSGGRSAHLGWSGLAAASSMVGFASGAGESLEVDPEVAMSYGWAEGAMLEINLIHNPPKAISVSVTPLSVDDWEILERQAEYLEDNLLAQLRAASMGQVVDVWVKGKSKIKVKIDETNPSTKDTTAALVNSSTEIYVAPRTRRSEGSSSKATLISAQPLSSVAQVLDGLVQPSQQSKSRGPSKLLRNLPLRIATQWRLEQPKQGTAWCSPATFASMCRKLESGDQGLEIIVKVARHTNIDKEHNEDTEADASAAPQVNEEVASLLTKLRPYDQMPDGHILLWEDTEDDLEGLQTWCKLRLTLPVAGVAPAPPIKRKGKEKAREVPPAQLFAVASIVQNGLGYYQRAQSLAQARTGGRPLSARPLLITGAKGTGRTSIALEISRRAERDRGLMADVMHVQVNRLPRDARLGAMKERMEAWIAEARARKPCVLILDDLDVMLGPESELAQSSQPEIVANVFTNLISAIPAAAAVYVIVTALGEDTLHPVLAGKHTFGQTLKVKALTQGTRGEVLEGLVDAKMDGETDGLDFVTLAGMTEGYSVTDLQDLLGNALQQAIVRHGCSVEPLVLEMSDFTQAQEGFMPLSLRSIKLQHSDVRWSDIGGLHETRRVLRETLEWPTKYGPIFASCPLRLRSGLLLYGFPGCGKTLLASAVAKECGLNFISVKGPEILNKYIGASEKSVRDLFERASAAKPCVLFFDEFDSIAPKRGHDSTGVTDRVVNQMLTQMDGAEGLDGVYVLAATSRPDLIDPALLRPGRLDKSLICDMPPLADREEILRAVSIKLDIGPDVDFHQLAEQTEGYSGADLQALVYNAHLDMVHASMIQPNSAVADYTGKGKQRAGVRMTEEEPAAFVSLSGVTMTTLSAAERAAMQQRLSVMLTSTDDVVAGEKVLIKRRQIIYQEHLLKSLENTRPSVPSEERARLQKIYSSFVAERSGKLANGDAGRETGSRVSLM